MRVWQAREVPGFLESRQLQATKSIIAAVTWCKEQNANGIAHRLLM